MIPQAEKFLKWSAAAVAASAALALTGCGMQTGTSSTSPVTLATLSGSVHGGQQPVSGARVYLLAVGQGGYGSGNNSNSLLTSSLGYVTTDAGGNFSITGQYTCPSNSQVYLLALGGNPGLAAGTNNGALVLTAGLGACSALTASTNINLNEVSTAAMAYAVAGFASNYIQISSTQANISGMARAFSTISNIVSLAGGTPLAKTPAGNGTVPVAMINTLADIIAPCVNSNGTDGNCSALFSAATVSGNSAPTDTFGAILSIAQNPGNNVAKIYSLVTPSAPFQPTLTTAPNDFTLAVNYSGANQPYGLAVDGSGSVWVSNQGNNTITALNYLGAPQQTVTGNGIANPVGVAVDTTGVVYVASSGSNSVVRIGTSGAVSSLTMGGLNVPAYMAIDGNNSLYVANQGNNSVSKFTPNGTPNGPVGFTGGNINMPSAIAVDGTGQVFVASAGNSTVAKLNPNTGAFYNASGTTGGGLMQPSGIAFDSGNTLLMPNSNGTVSRFNNTPAPYTGSPYSGGGTGTQGGVAIDGLGNIYTTNFSTNSLKVLKNNGTAISPSNGYAAGGMLNGPTKLGLDISGNLWIANNGSGSTSVTEVIGIGAPTVIPIAAGVATGTTGTRP